MGTERLWPVALVLVSPTFTVTTCPGSLPYLKRASRSGTHKQKSIGLFPVGDWSTAVWVELSFHMGRMANYASLHSVQGNLIHFIMWCVTMAAESPVAPFLTRGCTFLWSFFQEVDNAFCFHWLTALFCKSLTSDQVNVSSSHFHLVTEDWYSKW